jgi:hypothetical protein
MLLVAGCLRRQFCTVIIEGGQFFGITAIIIVITLGFQGKSMEIMMIKGVVLSRVRGCLCLGTRLVNWDTSRLALKWVLKVELWLLWPLYGNY